MFKRDLIIPILHECVDSTNRWAKENLSSFTSEGLHYVQALDQTAGRGTRGRYWHSLPNENILLTFVFTKDPALLPSLYTQMLSVAAINYLASLSISAQIKWPNDILIDDKKIAGILAEPHDDKMLLGIGLNVNMEDFTPIDQPATSIHAQTTQKQDICKAGEMLASAFNDQLISAQEGKLPAILKKYSEALAYGDHLVTWNNLEGYIRGITPSGFLLFEDSHGTTHTVSSGTIRKK